MCWVDLKLTYDHVCVGLTYDHVCVGLTCVYVCIGSIDLKPFSLGGYIVLDLDHLYTPRHSIRSRLDLSRRPNSFFFP